MFLELFVLHLGASATGIGNLMMKDGFIGDCIIYYS